MIVSADCEGETASYPLSRRGSVRVFQRTAREHCLLRVVESNGAEFFPVAHELVFDDNLVDRQFALHRKHVS
jgi:hypothetical protein